MLPTIIIMAVAITIGLTLTYLGNKGVKKETERNEPIAQANGLGFIPAMERPPVSVFAVSQKPESRTQQVAYDPTTGDNCYYLFYRERPLVYVRGSHDYNNYNLAIATVITGFWIPQPLIISERVPKLRKKTIFETGIDHYDSKYMVRSRDHAAAASIATPALMNAIDNPPVAMKDWSVTFLGPQVMVKCETLTFEDRIKVLRWAQTFPALVSTESVPGYGAYTVEVGEAAPHEVPIVNFVPVDNQVLEVNEDLSDADEPDELNTGL